MMNEKENARPDAATSRQAMDGEQLTLCGFSSIPGSDFNTTGDKSQGVVSMWLGVGAGSAVPLRQLAAWMEIDGRTVRQLIQKERLAGVPILSTSERNGGYFLAATKEEVALFCSGMRSRASEIVRAADAVEAGWRMA